MAVGLFGFLVITGLFIYELRGVQRCNSLSNCGRNLENEMLGEKNFTGTFVGDPETAYFVIGNTWASLIIYSTVISGWAYVALTGQGSGHSLGISAAAWALFVIIGNLIVWRQTAILKAQISKAKHSSRA